MTLWSSHHLLQVLIQWAYFVVTALYWIIPGPVMATGKVLGARGGRGLQRGRAVQVLTHVLKCGAARLTGIDWLEGGARSTL